MSYDDFTAKLITENTLLKERLESAVEALEDARNFLIISTGVHRNIVLEKVEAALANIKE